MMETTGDLIIAMEEEIGDPRSFIGRKKELDYLLKWTGKVKKKQGQSTAILARKKKGKTALLQRLYNILFTKNDPQLIPFYFKVKEGNMTMLKFAELFYRTLLTQYFGYKNREKDSIGQVLPFHILQQLAENEAFLREDIRMMENYIQTDDPELAWEHARDAGHRISSYKDERIIQIIDEFQFLDCFIYTDLTFTKKINLASFYQSTAESKVSPQLITGSYIGWLTTIIRKMVSRYYEYYLKSFPEDEALDAVYNYSTLLNQPVTDETAPFIAKICDNDPYYISQVMASNYEDKDLTDPDAVLATLQYKTTFPGGQIARIWMEYIDDALSRVNDRNAKTVVLYLAKYGDEERTVDQIIGDLHLKISPEELKEKLYMLERADLIAMGPNFNRFKGLGDKIFEVVFRRIFEEEIAGVDQKKVETDIRQQLASLKGQVSFYKGLSSEYRIINLLTFALYRGASLEDVVKRPLPDLSFGPFANMEKKTFHLGQANLVEVDIFCEATTPDGIHFFIEVKDWKNEISQQIAEEFITKKVKLEKILGKKTGFILYSEQGVTEKTEQMLWENGIMVSSGDKLRALSF